MRKTAGHALADEPRTQVASTQDSLTELRRRALAPVVFYFRSDDLFGRLLLGGPFARSLTGVVGLTLHGVLVSSAGVYDFGTLGLE